MHQSNIIKYEGNLWIAQDYLIDAGIDPGYIRVAKNRAKKGAKSWQSRHIANRPYFLYTSLTNKAMGLLDVIEILAKDATEVNTEVVDVVNRAVYSTFKLFLKGSNTENEARACGLIHEASAYIKNNNLSYRKSPFFKELSAEIKLQSIKHLPAKWNNLRDKIEAYSNGSESANVVKTKNRGNQNRLKYANNDTLQSWLVDLGESGKNYSAATIARKVGQMCNAHNMDSPSDRWVRNWLSDPQTQFLLQERYGTGSRFNHKYRSYTPTESALYAGDCWDIDGTRVQLISHSTRVMVDGKAVTKNKYLYIVAVRDVMSGDILGWDYCYDENAQTVTNAIAMAARTTGYLPYELRFDRFPGHNTQEWMFVENEMRKLGVIMTQTTKAEGKAGIERWWGTLQSVFMPESDLYYGEGIRSTRRHAHRSKEYVSKMNSWAKKQGFNYHDACNEFDKLLSKHATTPYCKYSRKFSKIKKSPQELHEACTKPNTYAVNEQLYAYLFGLRKEVSIRNYMILTQISNANYYYGIDDVEICEKYTGIKLSNCFDPENLDLVHLFDGRKYLGSFDRITPAQQYGPDKDMRAVGQMKAIGDKMKTARKEKVAEIIKKDTTLNDDGGEVEVLLGGRIPKEIYEAAETSILTGELDDEGEDIDIHEIQY